MGETSLPPTGTGLETFGGGSSGKANGFSAHSPAGSFSHQPSLFSGVHSIGSSVDAGPFWLKALSASGVQEKGQSPTAGRIESAFAFVSDHPGSSTINHRSSPSPAPSRLPLPAPESPGGIEGGGSGGSFFVPLVALLALLALVAPATLRRRLEAVDFPLPTQFVCALERPG
jgi:MYXO-CTERM domain-containing protein